MLHMKWRHFCPLPNNPCLRDLPGLVCVFSCLFFVLLCVSELSFVIVFISLCVVLLWRLFGTCVWVSTARLSFCHAVGACSFSALIFLVGHLTCKTVSEMTCTVSSGTLNPTKPIIVFQCVMRYRLFSTASCLINCATFVCCITSV